MHGGFDGAAAAVLLYGIFRRWAAPEEALVSLERALLSASVGVPPIPYGAEHSCSDPRCGVILQDVEEVCDARCLPSWGEVEGGSIGRKVRQRVKVEPPTLDFVANALHIADTLVV